MQTFFSHMLTQVDVDYNFRACQEKKKKDVALFPTG